MHSFTTPHSLRVFDLYNVCLTLHQNQCRLTTTHIAFWNIEVGPAIIKNKKHKATMRFKSLNGLAPVGVYLHELFSERRSDYDLRDSFRKLSSTQAAYELFET